MESQFVDALFSGEWVVVAGFVLATFVFLSRKLLVQVIPSSELDLVAAAAAVLSGVAAALIVGGNDSAEVILKRVMVVVGAGSSAVGLWELIGARLRRWYLARKQ